MVTIGIRIRLVLLWSICLTAMGYVTGTMVHQAHAYPSSAWEAVVCGTLFDVFCIAFASVLTRDMLRQPAHQPLTGDNEEL